MEKENHLKKQKTIITIIIVILLSVLILGISYAFFTAVIHSNSENKITTGVINFSYTENENAINLQNASSMTDEVAKVNENYFGFNLNVTATGTIKLYYYIYFTVDPTSTLNKDNVKVNLTQAENDTSTIASESQIVNPTYISDLTPFNLETFKYDATSNDYLLYLNNFEFVNGSTAKKRYYRFRMWYSPQTTENGNGDVNITETDDGNHQAVITGGNLKVKINIYSSQTELKMITK